MPLGVTLPAPHSAWPDVIVRMPSMSPGEALVTASIRWRLDLAYRDLLRLVVVPVRRSQGDSARAAGRERPARLPIPRKVPAMWRLIILTAERRECLSLRHELASGLDDEEQERKQRPEDQNRDPDGLHKSSLVLVGQAVEGDGGT